MQRIGIVGAGAWGTALAVALRHAGRDVLLGARDPALALAINRLRLNEPYLPNVPLNGIRATSDLADLTQCDALLLVVPAQFLRAACRALRPHLTDGIPLVLCAKGIELTSGLMMSDVVAAELPAARLAVLSGPTFASEVGRGLPTAVTLAAHDQDLARSLAQALGGPSFRPYVTDDVIGAEIGGAIKNVLAIACGVVEGRGLGENARAALITRGLAELVRLAVAKGGRAATCMGLSGLGDLILTASSLQSRNYSLGVALGEGRNLADILKERRSVTEGVDTAAAVAKLAAKLAVDMPICQAVAGLLRGDTTVAATITGLLARPFVNETGFE
jgi:glycerol-3-phosphate dehydrogenase (NAD(P)+)